MSDFCEMAETVRRSEQDAIAGKWLAIHASDVTPRTRHHPPPRRWPALTVIAVLMLLWTAVAIAIAAQAA